MDAPLLSTPGFWNDPAPIATGQFPEEVPDCPGLRGHVLFETSGTSGTPKWIALSKRALLVSARAVNRHLGVTPASCWGLALPMHHVGGFGVAARAFDAACRFERFDPRWNPEEFCAWLGNTQVTHTSLVPTQVHDLVAAGLAAPQTVRAIVVGGGHLDTKTGHAARELGWPVLASYGMTEAGSQIATQPLDSLELPYQPAPLPVLPIWQAEAGNDKRLRISGAALFSGTLTHRNGAWKFAARNSDWHQTEDRVELAQHNLTPIGRSDLRVKVLGELVDPERIERELIDLSKGTLPPGDIVILAVPHTRNEHLLVPVFAAAIDPEIIRNILSAYHKQTPGFMKLQPPVRLDDFPRSALGKPLRNTCFKMLFPESSACVNNTVTHEVL